MKKPLLFVPIAIFLLCGCVSKKSAKQSVTFFDGIYRFQSISLKYENLQEREERRIWYEEERQMWPEDYPQTFDEAYPVQKYLRAGQTIKVEGNTTYIPENYIECTISQSVFNLSVREDLFDPNGKAKSYQGTFTSDKSNFTIELTDWVESFSNKFKLLLGSGYVQNGNQFLKAKVYQGVRYSEEYIFKRVS